MLLTRYLSIPKLILLLEHGLFVPKVGLFTDPLEGTIGINNEEPHENNLSTMKWAKEWLYASCWHSSLAESFAMWKIYGHHNEAVAITVDSASLERSVTRYGLSYGIMNYVSYQAKGNWPIEYPKPLFEFSPKKLSAIPRMVVIDQTLKALFKKEYGYSYEKEVRLVLLHHESVKADEANALSGIYLPFARKSILDITVSPLAEDWFFDVVYALANRYKLNCEIYGSQLSAR